MSSNLPQKPIKKLLVRHPWQGISLKRMVMNAIGVMITLQAITLMILRLVAVVRQRRKHKKEKAFPYPHLDEVRVGKNYLQLYGYGQDLYDEMLEAIDGARESIYLETYIWKGDAIGKEFKQRLAQKAAQGVHVYVIFDWFGNLVVPHAFKVFPDCIHALAYQSIHRPWHLIDPRHYALDHRKVLVVDGSTGFIGGYNLGSLYATEWRDTHLRIRGPVAADLARSFVDFWNRSCRQDERISRRYQRQFDPLLVVRGNDALRLTFPIRDMYIEAIDKAERTISLTNAYFVPDPILLDALKAAAERGVDVRLLVPWTSNHITVDWLARGHFEKCLRAGIRIFGYRHMLHAKTCTIDGEWSTVGTANLDRLSSIGNFELNVEIYSEELAHEMQELFECDLTDTFELTLDNWMSRPWYTKLSERILTPLRFVL